MQLRLRFQEPAGEGGNRTSLIAPGPGTRRLLPRANKNEEPNRLPKKLRRSKTRGATNGLGETNQVQEKR